MKERRSASVSGLSLVSSRQENVAEPLPSTSSTVCAIIENGRAVLSSLTSPRLTPCKAGFQRAGQSAQTGIAGHDLDQRCGRFELAGDLRDFLLGKKQQAVFLKELAAIERADRIEILGVGR